MMFIFLYTRSLWLFFFCWWEKHHVLACFCLCSFVIRASMEHQRENLTRLNDSPIHRALIFLSNDIKWTRYRELLQWLYDKLMLKWWSIVKTNCHKKTWKLDQYVERRRWKGVTTGIIRGKTFGIKWMLQLGVCVTYRNNQIRMLLTWNGAAHARNYLQNCRTRRIFEA